MHIVLADNAIARSKSVSKAVPRLRACFHVGSCYEFHQAEGLNPTMHDFIVGDVTIELARMIDAAQPGQILVGDFMAVIDPEDRETSELRRPQYRCGKIPGACAGKSVAAKRHGVCR